MNPCSFVVGIARTGKVIASLKEAPHVLIVGSTGGGKSNFLRQMLTSLYINNKSLEFDIIDMKGGIEAQGFNGLRRWYCLYL